MKREQLIAMIESNVRKLGQRRYAINFDQLDDSSLEEMMELFRYLATLVVTDELKKARLSNRCGHLCLERRADRDSSGDWLTLCTVGQCREVICRFLDDNDARQFCQDYHIDP